MARGLSRLRLRPWRKEKAAAGKSRMARQVVRGWHRAKLPSLPLENDDASHGDERSKDASWLTAAFRTGEFGAVGALVGRFEVTKDWKIILTDPSVSNLLHPDAY